MISEIKKNIKLIIIIIVIVCIFGWGSSYMATSYALTEKGYAIESSNVEYQDNASLGVTNVQAAIDGTCTKFSEQLTELRESMYPIGSIYLSTSLSTTTAVESMLGGTWETYGKGKTLVGVDTEKEQYNSSNKEGGNNSVTLSAPQIPSLSVSGTTGTGTSGSTGSGYSIGYTYATRTTSSAGNHEHQSSANSQNIGLLGYTVGGGVWRGRVTTSTSGPITFLVNSENGLAYSSNTTSATGNHTHTYPDYYANSISGVAAHTHTIPSLSVSAKYTNSNVSSVNVQDEYITVYMYKRTA